MTVESSKTIELTFLSNHLKGSSYWNRHTLSRSTQIYLNNCVNHKNDTICRLSEKNNNKYITSTQAGWTKEPHQHRHCNCELIGLKCYSFASGAPCFDSCVLSWHKMTLCEGIMCCSCKSSSPKYKCPTCRAP